MLPTQERLGNFPVARAHTHTHNTIRRSFPGSCGGCGGCGGYGGGTGTGTGTGSGSSSGNSKLVVVMN